VKVIGYGLRMRRPSKLFWNRWLGMILLVGGWLLVHYLGGLRGLEQWTVDQRFRIRGPLESSARVYYVNRDAAASRQFGVAWFPREYYAMAGEALLELGGARAIFYDFVLTSDHLPKNEAPMLNFAGNRAMQHFLMRHPGQVVLAAAYGGKRYPFCEYVSVLPDRSAGEFRVEGGHPRGYDTARNPLPDLPEYPLWCPPVEHPQFPFGGIGEVGLINTSPALNEGEKVLWVPAMVTVGNPFAGLFLVDGMRRWAETVAWQTEGDARPFTTAEDEARDLYVLRNPEGAEIQAVPREIPLTFFGAALQLWASAHPGTRWEREADFLVLRNEAGEALRRLPLRDGQHLAVNWYGPWFRGNPRLQGIVESAADRESEDGTENWDVAQIGKRPEAWIEAVEAGDARAIEPVRLWGMPNDLSNPSVSIADVLYFYDAYMIAAELGAEQAQSLIRELFAQFEDTFVFVGPTDPLMQDLAPTPFDEDPVPRVSVHGNLLKMVADGRPLRFAGDWQAAAWALLLTFPVGLCATCGGVRTWAFKALGGAILVAFGMTAQVLFSAWDIVIPVATPLGAATTAGVFGIGLRLWEEERQKARIRHLFGTYVSPDVVNLMVDSAEEPRLGGHVREVTAFFSDIEAFSSIGEQLSPDVLVELMNEYLDTLTGALNAERGTLDKYIGDAIVGIFGAPHALPDHAARACLSALRMRDEQARLREVWRASGKPWPGAVLEMRTRFGLHTGDAVVGNMGSRQRFTYTMMGDSVNLASRLEQLGKTYGTEILVSESTRAAALETAPDLVFRLLDLVAVKGRVQPVRVYELIGRSERLKGEQLECVTRYETGMDAYLARDWAGAARRFGEAAKLESARGRILHPSKVMEARCLLYTAQPPPENWDGVFVMTRK